MVKLLRYAQVRAVVDQRAAGALPPLALVVKVSPRADLREGQSLLKECVALAAMPHPMLDSLLRAAGATVRLDTYEVPASLRGSQEALARALGSTHPSTWRSSGTRDLTEVLGVPLLDELRRLAVPLDLVGDLRATPARMRGMEVVLARVGATLRVTLTGGPSLRSDTGRTRTAARRPVLMRPQHAVRAVAAASADGVVVLADDLDRWDEVAALAERGVVALPVPGAPAWASVTVGTGTPAAAQLARTAIETLAGRAARLSGVLVAVAPQVHQAAAVAEAAEPLKDRRGRAQRPVTPGKTVRSGEDLELHPWQERFVAAFLSCGPGMVNAMPPGSGKTACAAAVMNAHATAHPADAGRSYRAVVVAPVTLRQQWHDELARFVPAVRPLLAQSTKDLDDYLAAWTTEVTPLALIISPALLTRATAADHPLLLDALVDLVVDEARFLANVDAEQSKACWALRERSQHAMPLAGTPGPETESSALLAFARGERNLFGSYPVDQPHPLVAGDRVGAFVYTGPRDVTSHLPTATATPRRLTPSALESAIDATARARVAAALQAGAAGRLGTELKAWRLGLSSPAGLMRSRYALTKAVEAALGTPPAGSAAAQGAGTKVLDVAARLAEVTREGGQALVFADNLAPLEDLGAVLGAHPGLAWLEVSSRVPAKERAAAVERFSRGEVAVLLVSATGQLGLNLQAAAHVFHLDVPATADEMFQRGARAARLGSAHERVMVCVPVLRGCGDEASLGLVATGAALSSAAVARALTRVRAA